MNILFTKGTAEVLVTFAPGYGVGVYLGDAAAALPDHEFSEAEVRVMRDAPFCGFAAAAPEKIWGKAVYLELGQEANCCPEGWAASEVFADDDPRRAHFFFGDEA